MKKYVIILILTVFLFSCTRNQTLANKKNSKDEFIVEKEKSLAEILSDVPSSFIVWFVNDDEGFQGKGYYKILKDGTIDYGIGMEDYVRLSLILDKYSYDLIEIYFSYILSDGRQVEKPPFYRVIVTKNEVQQVIDDVNLGKSKYYSIRKNSEYLGNTLPTEREGVELPWD